MLYYLAQFQDIYGPLRLFRFVTFRSAGALFTAMILTLLLGPLTVRLLKKFNTAAPSRHEGLIPDEFIDKSKEKTPSMGGLLIVGAITVSAVLWGNPENFYLLIFLVTLIALAAVGFLDDFRKVVYKDKGGLSGKLKLLFQLVIAGGAIFALLAMPTTNDIMMTLMVPFIKEPVLTGITGAVCAIIIGVLAVMGSSNAVNLTDGKDGLAVGCMIFCSLAYAAFAYLTGHKFLAGYLHIPYISGAGEVTIFAAATAGACLGFLWHNCQPASMFMGDTGSLALGGTIGLIAVFVKQEFTLVLVGGVFVIEALSVIIQVTYFKLSGGKRIFLCTPIHHHFERKGWKETQIVVRFWIISGILALAAIATLKIR